MPLWAETVDRVPRRARPAKAAQFALRYARGVDADLSALAAVDRALIDAVLAAVDDLAHGRQRGKVLGDRHVSGDLTGLLRLRVDLPGVTPPRFRIVYRLTEHNTGHDTGHDTAHDTGQAPLLEVLAVGERAEHAIYRDVLARLGPGEVTPPPTVP